MAEQNDLNKIIRKVYARELDLIASGREPYVRRQQLKELLRNKVRMPESTALRVALIALALAFVSAMIYYYNFFTVNAYLALQEKANVEAQLQRRADLIPNLVKAASIYLAYEKDIFAHIAEIRGAVANLKTLEKSLERASITDKSVLSKFQAVAEAYPALKASEAYTSLMKELSDTETKIVESRIKYNQIANYYNSRLHLFPAVIFNTIFFRFKPLPVFETSQTLVPDVQSSSVLGSGLEANRHGVKGSGQQLPSENNSEDKKGVAQNAN